MVAWNESRIGRTHRRAALVRVSTLLCKPMAPFRGPIVERARIGKQAAHTRVAVGAGSRVAQPAEDQGEIGAVAGHALKEVLCEGQIVRPRLEQAELAAEARGVGRLEAGGERVDCLLRPFNGSVLVLCKQR